MSRLATLRRQLGLTQAELADRAGVSRQTVGALEVGRHLPRVDAAIQLAEALGADVSWLFGPEGRPADILTGDPPREGSLLVLGQVGNRTVFSEARVEASGWEVADGFVDRGEVEFLARLAPGPVMVGCEPGLEVLERILREHGRGAVAVGCSNSSAVEAVEGGRAHMAVIHGQRKDLRPPQGSEWSRIRLCSWRVGLAAPAGLNPGWVDAAMAGDVQIVQRETGAGVQRAFEKAAGKEVPGPRSSGHLEAVRIGTAAGMASVTIEPAAVALGAQFHPLQTHHAEIWVPHRWVGEPAVEAVLDEIAGRRFQRRLLGVGGYDLDGIGSLAA